jgi:hypothetical protein
MDRTMSVNKCNACGGVYSATNPDGSDYYHRCPPLSAVELDAAVKAGKVALPLLETADVAITRRVYERANARDENVKPNPDQTKPGIIKANGAGAAIVANPSPATVIVP